MNQGKIINQKDAKPGYANHLSCLCVPNIITVFYRDEIVDNYVRELHEQGGYSDSHYIGTCSTVNQYFTGGAVIGLDTIIN